MSRARSIGNVYAELSVRDKMTVGVKRAESSLASLGKKLAGFAKGFALAAPAAAFAGLAASMKSAIDAGGQLSDMMSRTGIKDGEGLFIMQRAFENAGIAGEKVPDVINRMQRALVEAGQGAANYQRAFEALGLNFEQLRSMEPTKQFQAISRAIAAIDDPTLKAATAMQLFGRSGAELLVLMNDGKAFETAAKQVGGLGKTLGENADRLDRVSDAMTQVGLKFQQVGAEVAVALLPALEEMSDVIDELDLGDVTKQAIEFASALGDAAGFAYDIAKNLPGIKQARGMGGLAEKGIAWLAGFNPEEGTALPSPNAWVGGSPFAENFPTKMDEEAAKKYAEQIGQIPKLYQEAVSKGIPAMLKPLPESPRQIATGVPGLDIMEGVIGAVIGREFDRYIEENPEVEKAASPFADFNAARVEANEMQRRGLSFGGMNIAKEVNQQVTLLEQIRDVLRRASENGQLVWT